MTRFSERVGAIAETKVIQVDSLSIELRNSIWNLFYGLYDEPERNYWLRVAKHVATYFRKVPVDELPYRDYEARDWLKEYFYSLPWYGAYDLTEFIAHNHRSMTSRYSGYNELTHRVSEEKLVEHVNYILERELSGYRFIQGTLTPIAAKEEVEVIDTAIASAKRANLAGPHMHIRAALELFGKKPMPDYRNAIKEAISAVESVAKQIVGADSATLDAALRELSKKTEIHAALSSGFSKLYGYTSDESGIRHAILEEPNVGFAEAKYMIVSCSAFVNFLIQKADLAGLVRVR
jgi:hypothetical protein